MTERTLFGSTINVIEALRNERGTTFTAYQLDGETDILAIKNTKGIIKITTSRNGIVSPNLEQTSFKLSSDLSSSAEE